MGENCVGFDGAPITIPCLPYIFVFTIYAYAPLTELIALDGVAPA